MTRSRPRTRDMAGTRPGSAGDPSIGFLGRPGEAGQRLVVLMAARLALSAVSLGIALAVDTTVGGVDEPGRRGLYGTVALAFLATALTGVALPRLRRPDRFAALNIAADIGMVSSLVHFSGGPDSLFAFLYVVVALYGTLLFERRGALLAAGLGTVGYGAVLLIAWLGSAARADGVFPLVLLTAWGFHAGAMVTVAALASTLAGELRQRTVALEQLSNLYQRIVASLMSGLLTTDAEGNITSFNPEAESITGVSAQEAIGRRVETILPGVEPHATLGGAGRVRVPFHSRDGRDLHLGIGSYALRAGDAQAEGQVVIFQDVTEVVAMERDLRRSERLAAVGELSASIAHEIRNPLAAISGSIQMLRRAAEPGDPADSGAAGHKPADSGAAGHEPADSGAAGHEPADSGAAGHKPADSGAAGHKPADSGAAGHEPADSGEAGHEPADSGAAGHDDRRLMDIVLRETERLNRLIGDFLRYARPGPLQVESVKLSALVADMGEMLDAALPCDVELEVAVPGGLCVQADPGQLRQILWNLVVNAVHALPDGGQIRIDAAGLEAIEPQASALGDRNGEEKEASVEICVRDTGVGIPPDVLEHIFDPFFTTKADGSGLGLATVHRIVEEHGGSLNLESAEGRGTSVCIRLPRGETA